MHNHNTRGSHQNRTQTHTHTRMQRGQKRMRNVRITSLLHTVLISLLSLNQPDNLRSRALHITHTHTAHHTQTHTHTRTHTL